MNRVGRQWNSLLVLALGVGMLLAGLAACTSGSHPSGGASPPPTSTDGDFAGLVDIGGRNIYVQCQGSGSPTVVLISGNPIAADLWDSPLGAQPTVYQTASEDTRVCAYDRPGTTRAIEGGGFGRSDPVGGAITAADSVADLHRLLEALREDEPVVLAGHSYGGALARLYAHTHPDEVAGLVLVDSFTPELRDNFPAELWALWKQQNAMSEEIIADWPEIERFDFDETIDILRAGGSIRPIPLAVLTADAPITDVPKPGLPDIGAATATAHHAAQDQLVQLVPGAVHVSETHSGHNVMLDNPPVVTEAILDVVTAVREGRSTATTTQPARAEIDELVDLGDGRQMDVICRGAGSPAVFLISGRGNGAEDWTQVLYPDDAVHDAEGDDLSTGEGSLLPSDDAVLPAVARTTRVCAYDRPDIEVGDQVTTPRSQPHSVDQDVSDLHALAAAVGEPGPKVLVAHSYGGFVATLFARLHPDEVAGLVMVDAGSEQMANVVSPTALRNWDDDNSTTSDQLREGVRLIDAIEQIEMAPPMKELPAVVLMADKPWRTDLLPADLRDRDAVTFADWQAQLRRLATALGADLITETHSGHAVHLYNPTLVVAAVRLVVDEARAQSAAGPR
jgi:pimeloyl-ACP methyl ester carboxylesterase